MNFTDTKFLLFFLIFLAVYILCPVRYRRWVLLAGSGIFYAFNGWDGLFTVLCFTVINYIFGLVIHCNRDNKKLWTGLGVLINAAGLIGLKVLEKTNAGFSAPMGLSFYTFTCIAYLVDLGNELVPAEANPVDFFNFLAFFPKAIQGPIVRRRELGARLAAPRITARRLQQGLERFTLGFAMKVLLADRLGAPWTMYGGFLNNGVENLPTALAWLGVFAYAIQIYIDWESYMLMATGLGHILGLPLPENFDVPYAAASIGDYYRRWHMTLTRWFRDYIYIPLGGSRRGTGRTVLNILIVWLITSLWHGLSLNFLLWGMSIGVFIVLEKLFLGDALKYRPVLSHAYVLVIIPLTWLCFNTYLGSAAELGQYFARLFPFFSGALDPEIRASFLAQFRENYGSYWLYMLLGVLFCTPWPEKLVKQRDKPPMVSVLVSLALSALFWVALAALIKNGGSNPMYANF